MNRNEENGGGPLLRPLLLAALLVRLAGYTASAEADLGHHHKPLHVDPDPDHDVDPAKGAWPDDGFLLGHDHPARWLAPDHALALDPHGPVRAALAPALLSSPPGLYDQPSRPAGRARPGAVKPLDHHGFGRVSLPRADYRIEAYGRYGQSV